MNAALGPIAGRAFTRYNGLVARSKGCAFTT